MTNDLCPACERCLCENRGVACRYAIATRERLAELEARLLHFNHGHPPSGDSDCPATSEPTPPPGRTGDALREKYGLGPLDARQAQENLDDAIGAPPPDNSGIPEGWKLGEGWKRSDRLGFCGLGGGGT